MPGGNSENIGNHFDAKDTKKPPHTEGNDLSHFVQDLGRDNKAQPKSGRSEKAASSNVEKSDNQLPANGDGVKTAYAVLPTLQIIDHAISKINDNLLLMPVSEDFNNQVKAAIISLPSEMRKFLERQHVQIITVHDISNLRGTRGDLGYADEDTIGQKTIHLGEYVGADKTTSLVNLTDALTHEGSHLMDMALHDASDSPVKNFSCTDPEFISAWKKDCAYIKTHASDTVKKALINDINLGDIGARNDILQIEAFADVMAALLGRSARPGIKPSEVLDVFKNLAPYVAKLRPMAEDVEPR